MQKAYDETSMNDKTNLLVFLAAYRSTPNPNVPENKSAASWFIGRNLRLQLDILKDEKKQDAVKN